MKVHIVVYSDRWTMITKRGIIVTKRDRQAVITEVIRNGDVSTQEELLQTLQKERVVVNQSTLSRDLAELGIRKSGGRYTILNEDDTENQRLNYAGAVRRFTTCGAHMIVVCTGTGEAQAVALAIDEANDPAVVATLAGDDAIFIATKNRRTQAVALRRLQQWFGDKHEQ